MLHSIPQPRMHTATRAGSFPRHAELRCTFPGLPACNTPKYQHHRTAPQLPSPSQRQGHRQPQPSSTHANGSNVSTQLWRQHQVCSRCLRSKFTGSGSRWSRCSRGDGLSKAHPAHPACSQATGLAEGNNPAAARTDSSPAAPATLPGTQAPQAGS